MVTKKTAVSMDEKLFLKADSLARGTGASRSRLYASALESFIRDREDIDLLAEINEVCSTPGTGAERGQRDLLKGYRSERAGEEW